MRIYLDTCCLKRPFDDQSQSRIAVETAAVIAIARECAEGRLIALRSSAHDLENSFNTDPRRAAAVQAWLDLLPSPPKSTPAIARSVGELREAGLKPLDALHLVWAVEMRADALVTSDDRFLKKASSILSTPRIMNPTEFIRELTT